MINKTILVFNFLLVLQIANAQFQQPCIDSSRVNEFFQCNDDRFEPVCGCDNKTYRNDCESFNVAGVNYTISAGVCPSEYFYADFYPNPTRQDIFVNFQFTDNVQDWVEVRITDLFGKIVLSKNYQGIFFQRETFNLGYLRPGAYIISFRTAKTFRSEIFIKHNF